MLELGIQLDVFRSFRIKIPGTDFRVRYDKGHILDAIVQIKPFMKNNLVRYGDVLCLDAQKNQYNH